MTFSSSLLEPQATLGGAISTEYLNINGGNYSFLNNKSTTQGGAIYTALDLSMINVTADFCGNESYYSGGAISIRNLTISGGNYNFLNNIYALTGKGGGAIAAAENISIVNVKGDFCGNGGAIYAGINLIISGIETNLQFKDNSSEDGGAINSHYLTINSGNYSFLNNKARNLGGAINIVNDLSMINVTADFCGNWGGVGGAIHTETLTISGKETNLYFKDNSSILSGGGIYSTNDCNFTDASITFNRNIASGNGGAIFSTGDISFSGGQVQFINNTTYAKGGATYNTGNLTINSGNYSFLNNKAAFLGGAIYVDYSLSMIMVNADFCGNTCGNSGVGGAIFMGDLTISGGNYNFFNNICGEEGVGGAIAGSSLSMVNMKADFCGNTSSSGGAIITYTRLLGNKTDLHFKNNSTRRDGLGGAIFSYGETNFTDSSIIFSGNTARQGGAILSRDDLCFSGKETKLYFNNNSSTQKGGAIYLMPHNTPSSTSNLTIQNVDTLDFCGNHGDNGGAIYIQYGQGTFMNDTSKVSTKAYFRNNSSTTGGAIYHNSGDLNFGGGNWTFSNNTSTSYGSAIAAAKIIVSGVIPQMTTNLTFTDNSGINTIWATSFNTNLACREEDAPYNTLGCKNQYKFYRNTTDASQSKLSHIQLDKGLYMTGKWDFSNNIIYNKATQNTVSGTIILGHLTKTPLPIYINQADLSFGKVFKTDHCSSKAIKSIQESSYNYYRINTDTSFVGEAARDISNNRGN